MHCNAATVAAYPVHVPAYVADATAGRPIPEVTAAHVAEPLLPAALAVQVSSHVLTILPEQLAPPDSR